MWKTIKRILISIILVAVLIAGGATWFLYTASYSEGTRSGRLIKLSRKGFIFKTWEGQLDVGGLQSGAAGEGLTSLWDFSVDSGQVMVLSELEKSSGRNVKLHYEERYYRFFWKGDTRHFIVRVELLE
jgi:hypothetical protein